MFFWLCSQQINALINVPWVSSCSSVHWELKYLYFVSVGQLVCVLQLFVYVVVIKEFINDLFSLNCDPLSENPLF